MKKSEIASKYIKTIPNSMSLVRHYIKLASEPEVSFARFRVMCNVSRGLNTVSEIAELHGVSCAGISKLVESLVSDGYLERSVSPTDRRITELDLTGAGAKLLSKIRKQASNEFESYLNQLTESELNKLGRALDCLESLFESVQEMKN